MKLGARKQADDLMARRQSMSRRDSGHSELSDCCPPAIRAVFNTWELLESILIDLSMRDLLLLQRVSIAFRDVIRSSTPIQQKLFLAPVAQGTTVSGQETVPNPLLMDIFYPLYDDVLPFGPAVRADMVTSLRASPGRGLPLGSAAKAKQWKEEALNRRGASWRSMLLSQPPPRRLKYTNRVQKRDARLVVIARDAPVRMGAVYDLAYFALWRTGAVRVRWQYYAQFFDERGLPLLHDTTGLETPPGAAGFLDICVEENGGCASAAAVPHPAQLAPRWNESALARLTRLVLRTSQPIRDEPRCQSLQSEDYDRDAVAEAILPQGAGIADTEKFITLDESSRHQFVGYPSYMYRLGNCGM
ncbi:F-box-like domain-containing [Apiospora arundinis]|uniref:F-box-like domain-containing n=1 Tax=Apiospora arundinis TaxID=335852 RepID=A0ABR2JNF3_9PEZI